MVYVVMFAGLGILTVLCLTICWWQYWKWEDALRGVFVELARPGVRAFCDLQPLYVQQERDVEQCDRWYTRYHWCLLLGSVFFGLAAFSAVLHWTWGWPFWIHLPVSVLAGLAALLGCGCLGYGIVRERLLPLE